MGYTSIYAITFVALVGALLGVSKAQPSGSCVSTLTTLSPCLGYITGNSTTPSQTCCSQLDSVIKSSPQCICSAVNSPIPNIGLNINRTQALQLPNACNIQAPPLSQCNVATGPTTPLGALSPVESPADKNPGVALTPTSSPGARSGVVVGARGGSKTIPSTGAGSSSGSVDRVPPHLFIFICELFILFYYFKEEKDLSDLVALPHLLDGFDKHRGSAVPETKKIKPWPWPGLWTHTFLHSASKVLEIHFQYGNLQIRTSSLDGLLLLSCDYQDTSAISIKLWKPQISSYSISLAFFSVGVVKSCVLRVGIKCCKGCQTNAKRKLLSVSGVSAVEYNAEQGLLRVSGDPNPDKLLRKLAKWDKNAELVSLPGEVSAPAPRTPQLNQTKRMGKRTSKCFLLRCFGTKEKFEPYGIAGDENGSATPFINTVAPPMVYPPPQPTPGFATPIPYPPPCFGANQPPYTYTSGGMYQSPPPTFQLRKTQFPQMVNYPHH
ncbi:BnaC04g51000D [Brassica napus]|uniref:BnaC04g51000D protein n=1 Tax=Brassica napus TaxID=3708 RepID=A0A078GQI9_BRANA|nr:BnaC04g51000D [Brassica napus]